MVASANQDKPIFDAIPGYLAAVRGFARLTSATLMPPKASQLSTPESTFSHPDASRSMSNDTVAVQSRRNRRQRQVRRCQKLSLGSADSGIDMALDVTTGLQTSTDDDMRIGKVTPTLTMGHGCLPAQVLAEPATPGAQFVQHMAPVPVLGTHPWGTKDRQQSDPSLPHKSNADDDATSDGRNDNARPDNSRILSEFSWRPRGPHVPAAEQSCGCLGDLMPPCSHGV